MGKWVGLRVAVFNLAPNSVKTVLDEWSIVEPDILSCKNTECAILYDEKQFFAHQHEWLPATAKIYEWNGHAYILVKTTPYSQRPGTWSARSKSLARSNTHSSKKSRKILVAPQGFNGSQLTIPRSGDPPAHRHPATFSVDLPHPANPLQPQSRKHRSLV